MTTATPVDPFGGSQPEAPAPAGDTYDPFGDSQPEDRTYDGPLLPFPGRPDLDHHLIAMEPIAYVKDSPKSEEYGGGTEELFTVRLTVLAGEPMDLPNGKVNEATKKWEPDGTFTKVGADEYPWPVTWGKFTVRQFALIGQLKSKWDVDLGEPKNGGVLLGVLRKCWSKQTLAGLKTPDEIDAALIDYYQKKGANPNAKIPEVKFAWKVTNYTEDQKALALDWYRNRKTN